MLGACDEVVSPPVTMAPPAGEPAPVTPQTSEEASPNEEAPPSEEPSPKDTEKASPRPSESDGNALPQREGGLVVDFENGDAALEPFSLELHGNVLEVTDDPVEGDHAARFEYSREERDEWALPDVERGSEHCYSISFFFPEDSPHPGGIITQWHELPDRHLGENWRMPPMLVLADDDGIRMHGYHTSKALNTNDQAIKWPAEGMFSLGPLTRGQWIDFDFHVKWSYQDDGFVEVWRDGKQMFSYEGPNTYNDRRGNYWKGGVYSWDDGARGETIVLYHDDIRQSPAGQSC